MKRAAFVVVALCVLPWWVWATPVVQGGDIFSDGGFITTGSVVASQVDAGTIRSQSEISLQIDAGIVRSDGFQTAADKKICFDGPSCNDWWMFNSGGGYMEGGAGGAARILFGTVAQAPTTSNSYDLGGAGNRFRTLYLGTSIDLNGVSVVPVEAVQGYLGVSAEETPLVTTNAVHTGTGTTLRFTVDVAGVAGAGSAVLEILDGATQRCTLTFACNHAAGTIEAGACTGARTAGNNVIAQWDSTSDCTSLPLGNVSAPWQ